MAIKFKDLEALIKRRTGKENIDDVLIDFEAKFTESDPWYGVSTNTIHLEQDEEKHIFSEYSNELTLSLE